MKKFAVLLLGVLLMVGYAALGQPTAADQKWLEAVQKMVASGQSKVSTPDENRVNLLKEWGAQNGYGLRVTRTETGYTIELSRDLAQK